MRFGLSLIAITLFAAAGNAQLPSLIPTNQGKQQKDGDIEFTSRSTLAATAGRVSTHLCAGYWAGVRQVRAFEVHVQDQNDATQEPMTFEIRAQEPTTAYPDWTVPTATPLVSFNYSIPLGAGSIVAYYVGVTPVAPVNLPSGTGQGFYVAVRFPIIASGSFGPDGASTHMSAGLNLPCGTAGNPGCCGLAANPTLGGWELPKGVPASQVNIENMAPSDTPSGNVAFANRDRNYYHYIQTTGPTLSNLAVDPTAGGAWFCPASNPNGGHAAMHPDVNDFLVNGRRDRLGWSVNGGTNYANGLALVFLSRNCLETAIPVGFGDLYVDPTDVLFNALIQGPIALNAAGLGTRTDNFLPGNEAIVDGIGDLHCQALTINSAFSTFELTNLDTFGFTLQGGTPFTCDAANPLSVPITTETQIRLQNRGFGNLRAEFRNGTVVLGSMVVRERTTGAGVITPGSNNVTFTTLNTNPFLNNPSAGTYRF
jgi:hypothetical protein